MSDTETKFHETWLGMVQPVEGLVVSVPVLLDAQCMERQPPTTQKLFLDLVEPLEAEQTLAIQDLETFLAEILDFTPDLYDKGDALPKELALYVPEGPQTIRPTLAIRRLEGKDDPEAQARADATDSTPASRAAAPYLALLWDVAAGLDLDKPETETGEWEYPPTAKLDRLLRRCKVPIGILTNRTEVRLVYAPHGESTGWISFRVSDMAEVGGRPILDALIMLLSATRFFGVAKKHSLPALLEESRKRQANVTNELAEQVFDALQILLRGFESAAERDGRTLLDDAHQREDDHLYQGLLTVLLRLVFILYAEDRSLLPVENEIYAQSMSLVELFEQLQDDYGAYPDSMSRRFGAWGRLISLFRAIYLGVDHGELHMPPRHGELFNPHRFPFLEGWGPAGGAPISLAEDRAAVCLPTIDDLTVLRVLERLLIFQGQRLSYRTLDVEQIGSVYEALMGYHVIRMPADAVCLRPSHVWMTAEELLEIPANRRSKWLKQTAALSGSQAKKLSKAVNELEKEHKRQEASGQAAYGQLTAAVRDELAEYSIAGRKKDRSRALAKGGRLVIQPGEERRRTSSHYTPRSLSAPIVQRTIDPLLATLGTTPSSEQILDLKICDPAMGSGAFLVESCRYLADHLVAAWTREDKLDTIISGHEDPTMHARRLVAQRCIYGVDKNESAVTLAKLSLWLATLAKDLPFTFLDHSLRHGDSLVGLTFEQIRSFHWNPSRQLELCRKELKAALDEAIDLRQEIVELAHQTGAIAQRQKELLLFDANDALSRVRLIGDLIVGAFFEEKKNKAREKERKRRLDLLQDWLSGEVPTPPNELQALQHEIRDRVPVFHWMVEFPEIFYTDRPDPLDKGQVNHAAYMDAFVGNPPFLGGKRISTSFGDSYTDWLVTMHQAGKNGDLSAHFFRRADSLLGDHGTIGLIATNTIAQGDTRTTGIQPLAKDDHVIYDATTNKSWPGAAAVTVSVVHLAKGSVIEEATPYRLDGEKVEAINSRLRPKPERPDPTILVSNKANSFVGSYVLGMGFILTPEQRDDLVDRDPKNAELIFPYLGGKEVNSNPEQGYDRYVINFGQMSLEEAEKWPDLISIVREKVKPDRDKVKRAAHRKYWWHYGDKRPVLYAAIRPLERCLVCAVVSKHLMFSFQPTNRVFSHKLYVFPLDTYSAFATLQSRIHSTWTWLLSSTMKTDLNYSATDCFETFPFPKPDPRAEIPELEEMGRKLYEARAAYMQDPEVWVGLTTTYNRLKDPENQEPRIVELRRLHEEMDRAVLDAYGWSDIEVPPYCVATKGDAEAAQAFEDEVLDQLFVLNSERAEQEKLLGLRSDKGKKGKKGKKRRRKKAKQQNNDQLDLLTNSQNHQS